jgi:hypothetical protein
MVNDSDRTGAEMTVRIDMRPPGSLCVLSAAAAIAFSGPSPSLSPPCCQANATSATIRIASPATARQKRRRLDGSLPPGPDVVVSPRVT